MNETSLKYDKVIFTEVACFEIHIGDLVRLMSITYTSTCFELGLFTWTSLLNSIKNYHVLLRSDEIYSVQTQLGFQVYRHIVKHVVVIE